MYTNPAPKLLAAIAIIVIAIAATVTGLPGQGGFLHESKVLSLGPDLSGGTTLIYTVVSYEVGQLQREIDQLAGLEQTDERDRQIRQMRAALDDMQARFERNLAEYMSRTREVLQERLNATGLAAIDVIATGQDQIEVTLPAHMTLDEHIERVLTSSGRMYFRMEVDTTKQGREHLRDLEYPENPDPLRYRWIRFAESANKVDPWHTDGEDAYILVEFDPQGAHPVLHGEDLEFVRNAQRDPTNPGDRFPIGFKFDGEHQNRFAQLTREFQQGNYESSQEAPRLCIIFNEQVYWAGTIVSEIVGTGTMSGAGSEAERSFMINLIRAGSLPVQLQHESTSERGASLGMDAINQGMLSIAIGGLLVVLFVLIYYLGAGTIAVLSLIANLFIIFGVLVLFAPAATLTLPGIAGIILTVGMAIDANVLIFERIREERRRLASLREAVQRGYERSTVTILDANLTTAITGMILLVVGTPEIRGFATTLVIGIGATLFTTLIFGRYAIGLLVVSNTIKKFRMFRLIGDTRIPFMKVRAGFFTASTIVIMLTMAFFVSRGNDNLGIDFLGGHAFIVQLNEEAEISDIRRAVALFGERAQREREEELHEVADEEDKDDAAVTEEERRIAERYGRYLRAEVVPVFPAGVANVGQTSSTMFELRFPFDPDQVGARADQEAERRQIFEDLAVIFSGRFIINPDAPEDDQTRIPALVPHGISHDFEDATEVGFRIRVPLTTPVVDTQLGTARAITVQGLDQLRSGTLARFVYDTTLPIIPVSPEVIDPGTGLRVDGTIRALQAHAASHREDNELPTPRIRLEARDRELMIFVGGIAIDPEHVRSMADLEEFRQEVAERLAVYFIDNRWAEARDNVQLDTERELRVDPVLERGRLVINYRFKTPVPLLQWNIEMKKQLTGDDSLVPVEGDTMEGRMMFRLEQHIQSQVSGISEVRIPDGELGTHLVPDEDLVEGFQVRTGESSFRRVTAMPGMGAVHERTGSEAVERISTAVRLFLSDPDNRLTMTLEEPYLLADTKGPRIAEGLRDRATLAILLSLGFVVLYIWFRFRSFAYGLGATLAVAHDILLALGLIALIDAFTNFSVKIDLTVVAALLTIIGYSLNDTIVVFDRIRENRTGASKKLSLLPFINTSINEMLSRTVITSMTTFFVVFVLVLFGGAGLQGFAITLCIGILVGTYSSVFIAAPLVSIPWKSYQKHLWGAVALGFIWALVAIWVPDIRIVWFSGSLLMNFAVYVAALFLVTVWLVALLDFYVRSKTDKADAFIDQAGGRVISREASLERIAEDQAATAEAGATSGAATTDTKSASDEAQTPSQEAEAKKEPEASGETTSSDDEDASAAAPAETGSQKPAEDKEKSEPEAHRAEQAKSEANQQSAPQQSKPASSGGGGGGNKSKSKGGKGKGHQRGKGGKGGKGKGGKKGKR